MTNAVRTSSASAPNPIVCRDPRPQAEDSTMEEMFTDLFIPTLTFAQEELERRRISPAHDHFIKDVVRELIVRYGDRNAVAPDPERHIVAVSVAGERLSLGTLMLSQLLRTEAYSVDYFTDLPDDELVAFIGENLTSRLVLEVWPEAPVNDFNSDIGDRNEKAK